MYLLFCLLLSHAWIQAETLGLREAMLAASFTPAYHAGEARAASSREAVALERAWPEPRLGLSLQPLPVETRLGPQRGSLQLQQPLPWPGLLAAREEKARADAATAGYRLQSRERELRLEAARAWLALWRQQRAIERRAELLDWNSRQRSSLEAAYEAGLGRPGARLRAGLGEEAARLRLAEARDRLPGLEQALARALGRSELGAVTLPHDLPLPGGAPDTLLLEHNPAYLDSRLQVKSAKHGEALSRLANRPDLSLGLSWLFTGEAEMPVKDSGRDALVLSLNLQLPLWPSANRAREAVAAQRRAGAVAGSRDTELVLLQRWLQARDEWHTAKRDEEGLRTILLPMAEALLAATEEEYRGGLARYDELAAAAIEKTRLGLEHDASRARLWMATLELEELARPARIPEEDRRALASTEKRSDR